MAEIVLFTEKTDCCGCSACMNVCPQNAIKMLPDEYGFLYPHIDETKCISCGLCKKVCGYQKPVVNTVNPTAYAAINKKDEQLKKSASGGAFSAIASPFIADGGTVYGCAFALEDNQLYVRHIAINRIEELYKIQGSKYVQSDIGECYKQARMDLDTGKKVLFSGTPCQIAGLYAFLGYKEYNKLFTVDIVCHGVPGAQFFRDYLILLQRKLRGKITSFVFRDKQKGWKLSASATLQDKKGINKKIFFNTRMSSYYSLFQKAKSYRWNCYSCPYAQINRPGDITIGDFWGIEKQHTEYFDGTKETLNEEKGISCLLVNSNKGDELIKNYGQNLLLLPSTIDKVTAKNGQLRHPSSYSHDRENIMELYKNKGYYAVENWYRRKNFVKFPIYIIWEAMPGALQRKIKKMLKK